MKEKEFLFYSFLLGLFITFIYDLFRIIRRVFPHKGFWISVEDLVFWSYTCMSVFVLLQRLGDGNLRWFAVLGALAGMLIYKKTVSLYIIKFGARLLFLIILPIKKVGSYLKRVLRRCSSFLCGKAKQVKHSAQKKRKGFLFRLKKKLTFFLRLLKMTI